MTRRRKLAVVGAIVAVMMIASVGAYAIGTATVTNGVNSIRVKTSTTSGSTDGTAWVDIPGAEFNMVVPNGKLKTFIAEFNTESRCRGVVSGGWCSVRILIDGIEMAPAAGTNFAFDSNGTGNDLWESNAMTRIAAQVGPGQHTFKVQARTTKDDLFFHWDDWLFMVTKASTN